MQLAARTGIRRDVARLTSRVAAPAPIAGALLLGVACYSSTTLVGGLVLGSLLAICATMPSTLYIEHVLRHGGLSRRSERLVPLAIGCASVLMLVILVHTLEAPREVQTVLLTMLFALGVALGATPLIRLSMHTASIVGTVIVLQLLFGSTAFALLPVAAIVGWSRLELGEHTPSQVMSGAVVGAIAASAAYAVVG